ncbi:MAG: hypothetical protein ACFFBU_01710 [Promethearchaeota archaeon]
MFGIPRDSIRLVDYAFRALGKKAIPLWQLIFFLSFDLRQMPPSKAKKLIHDLHVKGKIVFKDDLVSLSPDLIIESTQSAPTSTENLGDLLRHFVSNSRLSRAVGMSDQAIEIKMASQNPLRLEATVHGSQDYILVLDEAQRQIQHNCPDWKRVSVLHRFCKHIAKLFLLLENDASIRVLQSLQEESWDFIQL